MVYEAFHQELGQGAIEYLMSYGWMVMIILFAGIAMWRIGVFDFSRSIDTTATGFTTIKPFTAACTLMGDGDYDLCYEATGASNACSGMFKCMFINEAGANIRIRSIQLNTTQGQCGRAWISKSGKFDTSVETCAGGYANGGTSFNVPLAKDGVFVVIVNKCPPTLREVSGGCSEKQTYTKAIAPAGSQYEMDVEIGYDITVGQITTRKKSMGTIRGTRSEWDRKTISRPFRTGICGDGVCGEFENCGTCPDDCGDCCGNGICEYYYDEMCSCVEDCGPCCGDGTCDYYGGESACGGYGPGYSYYGCQQDCGPCCGDGYCAWYYGESSCGDFYYPSACPQDCGPCCGDGSCDYYYGEYGCGGYYECPQDCGASCGDGCCSYYYGEDSCGCPQDCGTSCGDGCCSYYYGENCSSCEDDCGPC